MAVGRTKKDKIVVSWDCEPETSAGYTFKQTQRVLMTEEEAKWLHAELAQLLDRR